MEGHAMIATGPESRGADNEYLLSGEVARLLHVSPKTINRWASDGQIPCLVTLGGHRRFRRSDVDAAIEKMSTLGAALSH